MYLNDGDIFANPSEPTGWTHVVLNYNGERIIIFYNGAEKTTGSKTDRPITAGDGRIVVGRATTDKNDEYGTVKVDELILFNQALSHNAMKLIYNSYNN